MFVLGGLAACEILAQKFPALDNLWDLLHTLLRPLAGALAAGAALNTDRAFEILLAMVVGGTLAAASHSAKTGARLASTSKSLGTANPILSLGEDAAVVTGTLLSLYTPWVMLGVVAVFALIFALIGPRVLRTLACDLRIVAAWFAWVVGKIGQTRVPASLQESLLELSPNQLRSLNIQLEPGEELLGALPGWMRSPRGPRRCSLLWTPRRLLLIEPRRLRRAKVNTLTYPEIRLVRWSSLILFARIELLTRRNDTIMLNLSQNHARLGKIAAQRICDLVDLAGHSGRTPFPVPPKLAFFPR